MLPIDAPKNDLTTYLLALAAVLLWSTVATAFKLALESLTPTGLLLYASLASCAALSLVLLVLRRPYPLRWDRARLRRAALLGALNPFIYYLVLFAAYDRLPAQEAQALNYTWGVTLALLSAPILGQRLRRADLWALGLSYLGVVLIATRGQVLDLRFTDGLGVSLALGSTLIWSLYWLANAKAEGDSIVGLLDAGLLGALFVLGWAWLVGELSWPGARGFWAATYVGFIEMGVTFALWLSALKRARRVALISPLIFLSPFLSLVFIGWILGEPIRWSTLSGLALIVSGLAAQRARA